MISLQPLHELRQASSRYARPTLIGGLAVVAAYNAVKWRQDRRLARRLRALAVRELPPLQATPRVSVLVAAWNEAEMVERHIQSVLRLRWPDLELILCAGGTDGTYELARAYERPSVTVLEQRPGEGKQAALRRCLEQATGTIIFLTDADTLLDDVSFERTIGPVVRGEAEASTGSWRPTPEQLADSPIAAYRWSALTYTAAHAPPLSTGLTGVNAAVARTALEAAGGLREHVATGTDYHLAKALLRAGCRIRQVTESEVATRNDIHLAAYVRQQRRWLRNVVVHGLRFGAYREIVASLSTSLLGLAMLLAPPAALLFGPTLASLWLVALAHSAASKLRYFAFTAVARQGGDPRLVVTGLLWAVPLSLIEFVVWAAPFVDYWSTHRRKAW